MCCDVDRLLESIDDMKQVIMDSAQFLLTADKAHYSYSDTGSIFDVVSVSNRSSLQCLCFTSTD